SSARGLHYGIIRRVCPVREHPVRETAGKLLVVAHAVLEPIPPLVIVAVQEQLVEDVDEERSDRKRALGRLGGPAEPTAGSVREPVAPSHLLELLVTVTD